MSAQLCWVTTALSAALPAGSISAGYLGAGVNNIGPRHHRHTPHTHTPQAMVSKYTCCMQACGHCGHR